MHRLEVDNADERCTAGPCALGSQMCLVLHSHSDRVSSICIWKPVTSLKVTEQRGGSGNGAKSNDASACYRRLTTVLVLKPMLIVQQCIHVNVMSLFCLFLLLLPVILHSKRKAHMHSYTDKHCQQDARRLAIPASFGPRETSRRNPAS